MTFPYNDNIGRAWVTPTNWIQMEWLYPGQQPLQLYRAFRNVDRATKEQGFKGWLMASERSHTNMHKHIIKWGGEVYAIDDKNVYFKKVMVN